MSIETDATRATAQTIITDLEGEPVTIDKNPAHLDRFLAEISDYFRRSGKCLKDMGSLIRRGGFDSAFSQPMTRGREWLTVGGQPVADSTAQKNRTRKYFGGT